MRLENLDVSPHGETLLAVLLGALLATLSGIVANQLEAFFKRRERERDAALLFGELLSTLRLLLDNAREARGRGDPYGPITTRMLRAVRRELDIYDRNRERLYDLRHAGLRMKIHALAVRMTMPLDGILDVTAELAARPEEPSLKGLRDARDQGFDFLMQTTTEIPSTVADLGRLVRHTFSVYTSGVTPRATSPS